MTTDPQKLQQFAKEVSERYPPSKYSIDIVKVTSKQTKAKNSNKRRASESLECEMYKRTKYVQVCDFIGMSVKEALDKDFLLQLLPQLDTHSNSNLNSTADNVSVHSLPSTSSNRIISRELDYSSETEYDTASIEFNMRRLFSLYKLITTDGIVKKAEKSAKNEQEQSAKKKSKKAKNVHEEEYVVSRVIRLEWMKKEPRFEVSWKGYTEKTWEPVRNIYDCQAFRDYSAQFLQKNKTYLEQTWNRLRATILAESLQPIVTDAEALEKIDEFDFYEFQAHFFCLALFQKTDVNENYKEYHSVYNRVMDDMKYVEFYFKRLKQLQEIHSWLKDVNKVDKSKNLRMENLVDFDAPSATDFTYTNDVIAGEGVVIPDDPPVGCQCANGSEKGVCSIRSGCCPKMFEAKFAYTSDGRIRVPQRTPIFECNKRCSCDDRCHNRVVQKGRKHGLCIFKTPNGRGWGVRTERTIQKGAFICEYVGEIITNEETDKRGQIYDAEGRTYLFDLDFNNKNNPYTVDAAKFGNVSRYINHSCDPNLGVWAVWTDCLDLDLPKLCLFALRRIEENEELTFDYSNPADSDSSDNSSDDDDQVVITDTDSIASSSAMISKQGRISIDTAESISFKTAEDESTHSDDDSTLPEISSNSNVGVFKIPEMPEDAMGNKTKRNSDEKNDSIEASPSPIEDDESIPLISVVPNTFDSNETTNIQEDIITTGGQTSSTETAIASPLIPIAEKLLVNDEMQLKKPKEGFECRCGASNCRKIIFV